MFIAEGTKMVTALLHSAINVKQVYATKVYIEKMNHCSVETVEIKPDELGRISALSTPNEVLAVCEMPNCIFDLNHLYNKITLVLDGIKDPGNLGTIIRIADWFGIENILCSEETADIYNPKVVQATMGSIARVHVHYLQLTDFFETARANLQYPVFGALLEGDSIYSKTLPGKGFIIIGNESKGISSQLFPYVTDRVRIPSFSHFNPGSGEAESLNAAVAAAIICSEFRRH